jgi:DUF2075 family protein
MLVYHKKKFQFDNDVVLNSIADYIKKELIRHGINDQSVSEYNSWNNSMQFMHNVLEDPSIPDDADISIEYQIPLTSKRVDFIIAGADKENKDNVVIIELKQWSTASKIDKVQSHSVMTFVGGAERAEPHPCYQAYSYAVHIKDFSEVVDEGNISLHPCAYCHNFQESSRQELEDKIYEPWLKEAPLFLKSDVLKLREFIKRFINKRGNDGDLLYKIDNGRIRPTKALQDCLASMLKGKQEFLLLDEQSTIYDKCLKAALDTLEDGQKRVLIIEGGPGTGKSVLAINLLCDLLKKGMNAVYCTKNSAPRQCYIDLLSHDDVKKRVNIKELFRSPFRLCSLPQNSYDCLLVDEAHRLVKNQYGDFHGVNQIKECIDASRLCVFFIDESQRITTKDIGSTDAIKKWALLEGVKAENIQSGSEYVLHSEFRCNGSDAYVAFLDNFLGIRKTAHPFFDFEGFDFEVFKDPNEMRETLRKHNSKNKARMVAGYTFDWNVKNERGPYDIYLKNNFMARWNLDGDKVWAVNPESFEEVGCIHTAQGMEFDYVGVIIGKDLIYKDGQVQTNREAISKDDKTSGIRTTKDLLLADQLIRNTYKVLLTRGQKGCYVYCEDDALADYLISLIKKNLA